MSPYGCFVVVATEEGKLADSSLCKYLGAQMGPFEPILTMECQRSSEVSHWGEFSEFALRFTAEGRISPKWDTVWLFSINCVDLWLFRGSGYGGGQIG